MLSGVPNFAFAIGYTSSSWTLKIDLVCEHLRRAPVADPALHFAPRPQAAPLEPVAA